MTRSKALTTTKQTRDVWEAYERDRPELHGLAFDLWVKDQSALVGLPEEEVRTIVARADRAYLAAVERGYQTHAQQIAELLGAGTVECVRTLKESLHATKEHVLKDKQGNPILDENGEIQSFETVDHPTRLNAAVWGLKLNAAFPAEKIQVDKRTIVYDMTEAQLADELSTISGELRRIAAFAKGSGVEVAAVEAATGAAEGVHRRKELLLLADRMHGDGGRAGPEEPDQALPGQALPEDGSGLPGERA